VSRRGPEAFIKRVVAVGGDTIAIRGGHAIRNGVRAREPFTAPCGGGSGCDFPNAVRVPRGSVFVMGDNRGDSDDSRFWGPVPVSAVIGKAFATYWPLQRLGGL
jgi:signal peptidase I